MMYRGQSSTKQPLQMAFAALLALLYLLTPGIFAQHQHQNGNAPHVQSAPHTQQPSHPADGQPHFGSGVTQPRFGGTQGQIRNNTPMPTIRSPYSNRQANPGMGSYPGQSYPHGGYTGGPLNHPNMGNPTGGYTGSSVYHPSVSPTRQTYSPPGHLGAWLNDHRSLPTQDQERMLRSDPSFRRLPTQDQQRLVNQLHQVDQMSQNQRDRRLGRAEMLERLSPEERTQINSSSHRFAQLPADRQNMVKGAFRDLRSVPLDQRGTVLNSDRYQGTFTPEERGILSNLLRAEPYQAPQ